MYRERVDKLTFTAIALKTTGNYPYLGDRICEVGAVKFDLTRRLAEFSSLINPNIPISRYQRYKTGIMQAMLADAPSFSDIKGEFISFLGDTVLLFHDAPFNLSFLSVELKEALDNIILDILVLIKRRFDLRQYRLAYVAKRLGAETLPTHRALQDAISISEITKKLVNTLHPRTLGDILSNQGGDIKILGFGAPLSKKATSKAHDPKRAS